MSANNGALTRRVESRATRISYAFGHLVAACNPEDPHHADSGEHAEEIFLELGFDEDGIEDLRTIAEEVAGNWEYTGFADREMW